ncbi:MAG: peptidoglycan-binding domain-containing protein [Candidatus Paceibacterota bacterium]|jgi:hypothetical protein
MNKNIITYILASAIVVIPTFAVNATPIPVDLPSSAETSAVTTDLPSSAETTIKTVDLASSADTAIKTADLPSSAETVIKTVDLPSSAGASVPKTVVDLPSSAGSAVTPVTPVTPVITSGGGSIGGGSSSGGSRRANYNPNSSCNLISKYLNFGGNNDSAEVTKLQSFLKNTEKLNVDINGIFDQKTQSAVIAFQNKYAETILAPWGMTVGNGNVYLTTMKKVNQIACNQPLTLNPSELAMINDYKNKTSGQKVQDTNVQNVVPVKTDSNIDRSNSKDDTSKIVDITEVEDTNTATVVKASAFSRFWKFVVGLFK